jgi:uncharacterized phage-associated protein
MDYTQEIIYGILQQQPEGISRVRLAKLTYFVHKFLVQNKVVSLESLQFIRMPLGPVPVGLDTLNADTNIQIYVEPTALRYNKINYLIKKQIKKTDGILNAYIARIFPHLNSYPTSELVEISHQEPSWIRHSNGDLYYLESDDFTRIFPPGRSQKLSIEQDNQLLQAKLLEGMLNDIVDESTKLEYPDYA